jgi:hypothetical protein
MAYPAIVHKLVVVPPGASVRYVTPVTYGKRDKAYPTIEIKGKPMAVGGSTSQTVNYYGSGVSGRLFVPRKRGPMRLRFANAGSKPVRVRIRVENDGP